MLKTHLKSTGVVKTAKEGAGVSGGEEEMSFLKLQTGQQINVG